MGEVHRPEPLVPDPSPFEFEIAIAKLKKYNCQTEILGFRTLSIIRIIPK
jgi:hypothetical protein